jgi:hypothetical protein
MQNLSPNHSWLPTDIAIEIIGKMIAEQFSGLDKMMQEYENAGLEEELLAEPAYIDYKAKIKFYNQEIRQLYNGQNVQTILAKVDNEYAPYIKQKYAKTQYAS